MSIRFAGLEESLIKIFVSLYLAMAIKFSIEILSFVLTFVAKFLPSASFLDSLTKIAFVLRSFVEKMTLAMILSMSHHSVVFILRCFNVEIPCFLTLYKFSLPDS